MAVLACKDKLLAEALDMFDQKLRRLAYEHYISCNIKIPGCFFVTQTHHEFFGMTPEEIYQVLKARNPV
jgi:uncharacterized radical SAM superfamily Fe-S cluster-containing enzyme